MNAVACFNQASATPATLTHSTGTLPRCVAHEPAGHAFGRKLNQSFGPYRKADSWHAAAFAAPPLDGLRIPSSPLHEF
jgi:hypothetical protein